MITKEQLTGIKVKLGNKEDWDYLSNLCKSLGLEQATWDGCDFNVNSTAFVSGWEGKFLATHYWEDGDETSEEFRNLESLSIEAIKLMEKSVIIDKVQLDKTFIRNEGKLADKWLDALGEMYNPFPDAFYLTYNHNCVMPMAENVIGSSFKWLSKKGYREITLEDFQEGEEMVEDKKIIKKYIREEFNTRGQALDSYDSGVVFYTPSNDGYSVVDETGILDHFGQLFTLEEREETWQDVAQEFIKSNPIFDEDEFLLEMFSDDYSEYHEPMKQLAKLIIENSK